MIIENDYEIKMLLRHVSVLGNYIHYGDIIQLFPTHGFLTNDNYGRLFFHKSNCNPILFTKYNTIGTKLKFNLTICRDKFNHNNYQAVNVTPTDIPENENHFEIIDNLLFKNEQNNHFQIQELVQQELVQQDLNQQDLNQELVQDLDQELDQDLVQDLDQDINQDLVQDLDQDLDNGDIDINSFQNNINPLFLNCDVWYMNGLGGTETAFKVWEHCIDNNFVYTWNYKQRNRSIFTKLKINDKIAWYFKRRGFVAILEVTDKPCKMNINDLSIIKSTFEDSIEEIQINMKTWDWYPVKIPVKFIAHTSKYNCINESNINESNIQWASSKKWTRGLRSSHVIKPSSEFWLEQVSVMYQTMKK